MAPPPVWRICLQQLGADAAEAAELASVLQELHSNIEVTGLAAALSARTSTSCGTPRKLSSKERIRRAAPLGVGTGAVPWSRLSAVVTSDALREPSSPGAGDTKQPQVLQVNSGGQVVFLVFDLQQQREPGAAAQPPGREQQQEQQPLGEPALQPLHELHARLQEAQQAVQLPPRAGPQPREGVAVLKLGASRLAMQAEQFANELTRHLSIVAPDCRIIRQAGPSAEEWNAALAAVQRLAAGSPAPSSGGGAGADSASGAVPGAQPAGAAGAEAAGDATAAELLAELSHMRCFLLMQFCAGTPLYECPQALDPAVSDVGLLCEDVGRLFLLDMVLGNADRMACPELGWRGNSHNLLYGLAGSPHAGRICAIDSCVARRPPALKANAEDAAVERLAQLLLAVPAVSRGLLQQLLAGVQRQRAPAAVGQCSRLSIGSSAGGSLSGCASSGGALESGHAGAAAQAAAAASQQASALDARQQQQQWQQQQEDCAAGFVFSDEHVARFQAGVRQCLSGVLQIKGLLEMISSKVSEWIAELVEDVVRLNPALLPSQHPSSASPGSFARSPRPSPRPSARSSLNNLHASVSAGGAGGSIGGAGRSPSPGLTAGGSSSAGGLGSSASAAARACAGAAAEPEHSPLQAAPSASSGGCSGSSKERADNSAAAADGGGGPAAPGLLQRPPASCKGMLTPLARRAVSSLGFQSIKAAICSAASPAAGSSSSSASPPSIQLNSGCATPLHGRPGGVRAGSLPPLSCSGGSTPGGLASPGACLGTPPSNVASAVAAALSPRATAAQAQVLAGVFGGAGSRSSSYSATDWAAADTGSGGGLGIWPKQGKPSCARRVTWTASEHALHAAAIGSHGSSTLTCATPPGRGVHSSQVPPLSSPDDQLAQPCNGRSDAIASLATPGSATHGAPGSPPAFSRHLSFTSAGGSQPPQTPPAAQRSSGSSSLQVLASLQLDATLASINHEARHDGALAERLAHWRAVFRERGAELSAAIAAWQARHNLAAVLSTGFLDGGAPIIVDAYELGVRLQHMLRRLSALAAGAAVQAPIRVLPRVFLGNAVAADSHHLLQFLGVTHVVNAAQELQQMPPAGGPFHVLRVAICDEEREDVAAHWDDTVAFIDAALAAGGAVLVHCHEGRSRSVALLLAYLMRRHSYTLAGALAHIRSVRPEAAPNAGFMQQLMRLDVELHGASSLGACGNLPRGRPEPRVCAICGATVGVSYASLAHHTKAKHGLAPPAPA